MARMSVITLAVLAAVLFCLANLQVVEVKTVVGRELRASLALVICAAFSAGFAVAMLLQVRQSLRRWNRERVERQRTRQADASLLPPPPRIVWPQPEPKRGRFART